MYLAQGWKNEPNGVVAARKAALAAIMNQQKATKPKPRPTRRAPPCPPADNNVNKNEPPQVEHTQTDRVVSVSLSKLHAKPNKIAKSTGKNVPREKTGDKAAKVNRQIRRRRLNVKEQFFQDMKSNPIAPRQKSRSYFDASSRQSSQGWMANFDWKPVKEKKYVGDTSQKVPRNRFYSGVQGKRKTNNRRRPQYRKAALQSSDATNRSRDRQSNRRGDANIEKYKKIIKNKDAKAEKQGKQDASRRLEKRDAISKSKSVDKSDGRRISLYEKVLSQKKGGNMGFQKGKDSVDDSSSDSDSSSSGSSSDSDSSSGSSDTDDDQFHGDRKDSDNSETKMGGFTPVGQQKDWKRQLPPGSPSDIAILRRCDSLAEYVEYLENKYGVGISKNHWKQIRQVDERNRTGITVGEAAPLTPQKNSVTPEISSLEYTGGDESEQRRVRAMIRARVAADVEAERRRRLEKELQVQEEEEKVSQKEYVNDAVEMERLRRVEDENGELIKQRGARRLSLNFINDLIQKDPTFITKTWGY